MNRGRNYKRVAIKEIVFKSFSLRFNVLKKERWGWGKSLCNLWASKGKGNFFFLVVIVCGGSSNSIVQEAGSMILLWLTLHGGWEKRFHLQSGRTCSRVQKSRNKCDNNTPPQLMTLTELLRRATLYSKTSACVNSFNFQSSTRKATEFAKWSIRNWDMVFV